jgi:hypothetical protein
VSDPDPLAETHAEFERVKAQWYSAELHRPEFWADLASRDVPFLIGEVERLRALIPAEWERGTCRICGEPITYHNQWWHVETTRDHDAQPAKVKP